MAGRYLQAQRELILPTSRGVTVHISDAWCGPYFGNPKHPSPGNSPEDVMGQWKCQLGLLALLCAGQKLSCLMKLLVLMRFLLLQSPLELVQGREQVANALVGCREGGKRRTHGQGQRWGQRAPKGLPPPHSSGWHPLHGGKADGEGV